MQESTHEESKHGSENINEVFRYRQKVLNRSQIEQNLINWTENRDLNTWNCHATLYRVPF